MLTRLAVFVCTFGYVGYSPVAPGTAGSMAGLIVFALLRWLHAPAAVDGTVILLLFAAGVWSGTHAERYFGTTDPGPGVIDEVVGMLITLFLLPVTWSVVTAGFLVFRILDVIKPSCAALRVVPRGNGHDGGRRDVGHLRQPAAAAGRVDCTGLAAVA